MTAPLWTALGEAVRVRRERLRLPQDLQPLGGPGEITVRKIERAEAPTLRPKTRQQLEIALNWPAGVVDRILAGEATDDDIAGEMLVDPDGRQHLVADPRDVDTRLVSHGWRRLSDVRAGLGVAPRRPDGDLELLAEVVRRFSESDDGDLAAWARDGDRHLGRLYRRRQLAQQVVTGLPDDDPDSE